MNLQDLYYLYYEYGYEIEIDLIHHDMVFGNVKTLKGSLFINLVNHEIMKIINYFEGGNKNAI